MNSSLIKGGLIVIAFSIILGACKKSPHVGILNTGEFGDTSAALKSVTDIPIGAAINYGPMITDATFASVVKRDFNSVTFGYEMKHGAVVRDNGSFDFTNTDALVNAATGVEIFGHTLGWHQNQNANYLKSFAGIVLPSSTELLTNPGFESGMTGWSTFNSGNPAGSATITTGSGANEVRTGTSSMKVVNPTAYTGNQWRVQVSSIAFPTTPGTQYTISYWVKAAAAGGSIRLSSGPTAAQYQGDQTIGTAFQQVSWTITANLASTTFLFDMGQVANTYYIDDVSVKEVIPAPSGAQVAAKLDQALNTFITTMVNRYKSKVKAWDVVNELFADDGSIRNNTNTPTAGTDVLVWSNYMGRDYALKAFQYAAAADPTAVLYINDYALETNARKLDSLIAFVNELKTKGAKVGGIGTQMHISWNTSYDGIDKMFQKLAATGLKIRVSELDIRTVNTSAAGKPTATLMAYQANTLKYVVTSYLKNIPKAQQAGITIWGIADKYSWLYNSGKEFPLLYDNDFKKKPAYAAFLQALRGQ